MKRKSLTLRIAIIGFISLMMVSLVGNAQVLTDIQKDFNRYKQNALQEKIFVHTDKSFYLAGEILWFKIYCVDGTSHKPLDLSKVAYVEVLDNNQAPVLQAKVALKDGSGSASIYLPVNINNGNYKLRTYTNWMKNFNPEYYFEKNITIVNPLKTPDASARQAAANYDIQFFPEGGNLISGLSNNIAFKAVGEDGKGIAFKGAIIDQRNDTVALFQPLKFGIGHFLFTPAANNTYRAVIKVGNGNPVIKNLPTVNSRGYTMQLTDKGAGQLDVAVSSNNANGPVYIFAHTRQAVKVAESAVMNNGTAHFTINKNKLDEGVSHITIFNSDKQPVCERLYFKRPKQRLFIEANADQPQYTLRKKVDVTIAAKDTAGKLLTADLSMAVYPVDALQEIEPENIFNYLWLSSDLKGNIESPDYYFKNNTAEADEALDNLMLSQGWRRFQWNNILSGKPAVFNFMPEYEDHLVTAKITNSITHAPAKDILTYMGVPGKRVQFYVSKSDSTGQLIFNTRDFYGTNELVIQTNTGLDSTYRININSPFSEQFSSSVLPPFRVNNSMEPLLKNYSLNMQAQNIYLGSQLKKFYSPMVDSSAFYGQLFTTYLLDNYTRYTTMEEVLIEYVKGIQVSNSRNRYHIDLMDLFNSTSGQLPDPLVLIDGVPILDMNKVIALDPLKIKKLDVINNTFYYGPSVNQGVFSFSSYKGDLGGYEIDPHAVVIDYEGLELQREFYSPVYETPAQASSRMPDLRNLLYWSPNIGTYSNGKNQVTFYTGDQTGKYIGIIQGNTANGDAGSQVFTFDVK